MLHGLASSAMRAAFLLVLCAVALAPTSPAGGCPGDPARGASGMTLNSC